MPGVILKSDKKNLANYVKGLEKIPYNQQPLVIILISHCDRSHAVFMYRGLHPKAQWQLFDSNQMNKVADSTEELVTLLQTAFFDDEKCTLIESIFTLDQEGYLHFLNRQQDQNESIRQMICELNETEKTELLLHSTWLLGPLFTQLLLEQGADPNSDNEFLKKLFDSGNQSALQSCLSPSIPKPVTEVRLSALVDYLFEQPHPLMNDETFESLKEDVLKVFKAYYLIKLLKENQFADAYELIQDDSPISTEHLPYIDNLLCNIQNSLNPISDIDNVYQISRIISFLKKQMEQEASPTQVLNHSVLFSAHTSVDSENKNEFSFQS